MKKRLKLILATVLVVMLASVGCTQKEVNVKDREGNDVKLPNKTERIISTAPSNTEVLVELGLGEKLVAVDTYSSDVAGLPKEIEYIDFSNPDAEAILALEPDMIIASGHNKTGNNEDPFKLIKDAGISVFYIPSSDSIQGVYDDIMFISEITKTEEQGKKIVENMKAQVEEIANIGKTITDKKKVYFEIGPAPNLFSFGNSTFLNEMIEIIGAENIFANEKSWIAPSEEAVLDGNPDVIFTNVDYVKNPTEEIKSRKGWDNTTAVKENQVYFINKNASSRPSHKIIIALEEMAKAIYPNEYGQK